MATRTQPAPAAGPVDPLLTAYGKARSTVKGEPLSPEELRKTNAYWQACNYLAWE